MVIRIVFIMLFFVMAQPLLAIDSVDIEIPSGPIHLGESLDIEVKLRIPHLEAQVSLTQTSDFEVQSHGSSLEQRFDSSLGFQALRTLHFRLTPKKVGLLTLPTFTAEFAGQTIFQSASKQIEVIKGRTTAGGARFDIAINPRSAWVGQQVVLSSQISVPGTLSQLRNLSESTHQFWYQDFPAPAQTRASKTHQWKQALFPLVPGEMELPEQSLEVFYLPTQRSGQRRGSPFGAWFFDDLFSRQNVERQVFVADGQLLEIRPVPKVNKKSSSQFQAKSPIVGDVELALTFDTRPLTPIEIGDNIRATLILRTNGNGALLSPNLIPISEDLFVQEMEEAGTTYSERDGLLWTERRYIFTMTAHKGGKADIGPFRMSFFHPGTADFVAVESDSIRVEIRGGIIPEIESPNRAESDVPVPQEIDLARATQPYWSALSPMIVALTISLLLCVVVTLWLFIRLLRRRRNLRKWIRRIQATQTRDEVTHEISAFFCEELGLEARHPDGVMRSLKKLTSPVDGRIQNLVYQCFQTGTESHGTLETLKADFLSVLPMLYKELRVRKQL
jgi:hypothetical protein